MDMRHAVSQINLMWEQIARTATFRGYRPASVATTGIIGIAAAIIQTLALPHPEHNLDAYIHLWSGVASICVLTLGIELAFDYQKIKTEVDRRLMRAALSQFCPCLIAGLVITWTIIDQHPSSVSLLPGLWSLCFSLGVFASLPYVAKGIRWVSAYYMIAGGVALQLPHDLALSPWIMGGIFGVGQLAMACVLATAEGVHRDPA